MSRIGILGGTFDPPHVGHLWLAALAADELRLDRVRFLPASLPPHKRDTVVSSADDRLAMTRLATADDPVFEVSTLELERSGPSYAVDSAAAMRAAQPGDELFWIMAADSLAAIDEWRDPDRLLDLIEWVVGPRPGSAAPDRSMLEERFGSQAQRIHLLSGPALAVSASEIRARVAGGRAIRYLVPASVERHIAARRLYVTGGADDVHRTGG